MRNFAAENFSSTKLCIMKANRITLVAIFCLCFFTISLGENATAPRKSKKVLKQTKTGITFVVDEDLPAPKETFTLLSAKDVASRSISNLQIPQPDHRVVKTSFEGEKLCYLGEDNFFKCVVRAFADHRSLVLSPDMVWLLIDQGFSRYVNAHSEELRDKLVLHQGKMTLRVDKDNNVLDPAKGDWSQLLNDFSALVAENTKGEVADMMIADFSTTGVDERIASQITLMEAVKSYFDFSNRAAGCGFPTITLEGTPEDWKKVREKARSLSKYGLEKWANELDPILAEFVKASEGNPNQAFWESMVMKDHVEKLQTAKACGLYEINGTTHLDGWILKFFPNKEGHTPVDVLHAEDMPSEMARGNFTQEYFDPLTGETVMTVSVQLWAGFVGVQIDEKTGAFTPKIGWFARLGNEEQEQLSRLYQLDRFRDGLSYSYRKETDTLPGILAKMTSISKLKLLFYRFPVKIPAWVDNMKIGKLEIEGMLSEAEEAQLRQRFPKASITNNKPRVDAIKKPSDSTNPIDLSEFDDIIIYEGNDIRQVIE